MAMGSRRVTPTSPVIAAVVSDAMLAPTKTPCCQLKRFVHQRRQARASSAEDDRRNRNAGRIFPVRRYARRLLRRNRVPRIRVRRACLCRPETLAPLPVDQFRGRALRSSLPTRARAKPSWPRS